MGKILESMVATVADPEPSVLVETKVVDDPEPELEVEESGQKLLSWHHCKKRFHRDPQKLKSFLLRLL